MLHIYKQEYGTGLAHVKHHTSSQSLSLFLFLSVFLKINLRDKSLFIMAFEGNISESRNLWIHKISFIQSPTKAREICMLYEWIQWVILVTKPLDFGSILKIRTTNVLLTYWTGLKTYDKKLNYYKKIITIRNKNAKHRELVGELQNSMLNAFFIVNTKISWNMTNPSPHLCEAKHHHTVLLPPLLLLRKIKNQKS